MRVKFPPQRDNDGDLSNVIPMSELANDEGLTLEKSASLSLQGGDLTNRHTLGNNGFTRQCRPRDSNDLITAIIKTPMTPKYSLYSSLTIRHPSYQFCSLLVALHSFCFFELIF